MNPIIESVQTEVKQSYRCPACKSSRRAKVVYDEDFNMEKSQSELVLVIVCRVCGNEEVRYYPK